MAKRIYNWIRESHNKWGTESVGTPNNILEIVKVGCLQRIADAAEDAVSQMRGLRNALEEVGKSLSAIEGAVDQNPVLQIERTRQYVKRKAAELEDKALQQKLNAERLARDEKIDSVLNPFIAKFESAANSYYDHQSISMFRNKCKKHLCGQLKAGEELSLSDDEAWMLALFGSANKSCARFMELLDKMRQPALTEGASPKISESPADKLKGERT